MVTGLGDVGISLIAVCFIVAVVLAIAWADFGHPRHAITWSFGCKLIGFGWILVILPHASVAIDQFILFLAQSLIGTGVGMTAAGFGQRCGRSIWRPIGIMNAMQIAATVPLIWWWRPTPDAPQWPLYLMIAGSSWFSSQTLIGRRKGERTAERLVLYWLRGMTLGAFALLAISIAALLKVPAIEPAFHWRELTALLPATMTCSGIFAVFLLTADLADQSRRLAGTDMLTGLLNRRGFQEAATAVLASAQRNARSLCLTVIDIDHFKEVNDRFGHLAGDEVLRRFAACLLQHANARDVVARVGGEEFALVLMDRDCANAHALLEDLRTAIAQCPLGLPDDYRITASFGLAALGTAYDLPGLFEEADRALYAAKAAGRNRVVIAD
ncbi:diguanylate cyclase (GGDEF)-like protein [Sphingomonas vulcanisoli]|uniref:diguanylate cyclase n=1 Tax=Sphingomonas vulcanisoli TaxID=1658060 RepID=A0ABX0TM50_9SPHN|nr:GGDEF domain-containing protein [Sphingomonas vulcanisoli]NIJ06592.1 diguanylate cyclase (GGDEF)-like protein [Sphingomonas vulcanisoli]